MGICVAAADGSPEIGFFKKAFLDEDIKTSL